MLYPHMNIKINLIICLIILFNVSLISQCPDNIKEKIEIFQDYKIRIVNEPGLGELSVLQIFKNDQKVYENTDGFWSLGHCNNELNPLLFPKIKDITGDGEADIVIYNWSRAAYGDYICYLFQISKEFKMLDSIQFDCGGYWENLNGNLSDGLELVVYNFCPIETCRADTNMTMGIFRFSHKRGKFCLAEDQMSDEEISEWKENEKRGG